MGWRCLNFNGKEVIKFCGKTKLNLRLNEIKSAAILQDGCIKLNERQ